MKFLIQFFIFSLLFINPLNSQILFSEYSEGSSYNKYIEIYNYSNETIGLFPQFVLASCTNGCIDGTNFYINEFPEGASIAPGDVYVVAATQADQAILDEADFSFQYCCGNGDDAYALMLSGATGDVFDSSNALDIIGNEDTWQEGIGWDVAGVAEATKNHTLVRKGSVSMHNAGDWPSSAGTNSDNSEWIVLEIDDWSNLGFHDYDNSSNNIFGCMCQEASNYMSTANIDDGSCIVEGGCSDPVALNYSGDLCLSAQFIDEDCEYATIDVSGCYNNDLACNNFDFEYQITAGNMTIAIVDVVNLVPGDLIGVFYINESGFISCGGSVIFEGAQLALSAWGDDASSVSVDGFQAGDQFVFLVLRDGLVYEAMVNLNNLAPFTNTYLTNGFGQITNLSIGDEFFEDCITPPLGYDCNGNSIALEDDIAQEQYVVTVLDMFGRTVTNHNRQNVQILIFNNGTVEKKYFLGH